MLTGTHTSEAEVLRMSGSPVALVEEMELSPELVSKKELLEAVRGDGLKISDRMFVFLQEKGLVTTGVRFGRTSGYPSVNIEKLEWILRARERGTSVEALTQLVPLWRLLIQQRTAGVFDLAQIERLARATVDLPEANATVPALINEVVRNLCRDCRAGVKWQLKDDSFKAFTDGDFVLNFLLAEVDPDTGLGNQVAFAQLQFPGLAQPDADDPATLILGIPNEVELARAERHTRTHRPRVHRRPVAAHPQEGLPLE